MYMSAEEQKELLEFGLRQGLHNALNWMVVMIIGWMFHLPFWQSLLFYFFYCLIRVYAGGYHSKTRVGCYGCSIVGIGISFVLLPIVEKHRVLCIMAMASSIVIILLLAPMDNPQKRLSQTERNCFRKKVVRVVGMETAIFFLAAAIGITWLYGIIVLAMMFVASMLIIGWVKWEK